MRVGIIGFGYMGHFHLNKCAQVDGLTVTAAHDIDPERLKEAREAGLLAYASLDDLLATDIQLVLICTPNNAHAPLAAAALRAGKHVMCEKPVTMSAQELLMVQAVAREAGRIFTVHQNRRWDVDFRLVKQVLDAGSIGRPTTIVSRVYGQRGVCFGWRADPQAGGGMLYDWGIHLIDQFLQMLPNQRVMTVYARLQSILTPAVDDSFELQLHFESGVCATIQVGTFCLEPLPRWFVYGDRGTLCVDDFAAQSVRMARIRRDVGGFASVFGAPAQGPSRTMSPLKPEFIETLDAPVPAEEPLAYHRNLLAACEGRAEPIVRPDEMLRAMRLLDLAFESARKNQVLVAEG